MDVGVIWVPGNRNRAWEGPGEHSHSSILKLAMVASGTMAKDGSSGKEHSALHNLVQGPLGQIQGHLFGMFGPVTFQGVTHTHCTYPSPFGVQELALLHVRSLLDVRSPTPLWCQTPDRSEGMHLNPPSAINPQSHCRQICIPDTIPVSSNIHCLSAIYAVWSEASGAISQEALPS